MRLGRLIVLFTTVASVTAIAQGPQQPDWGALEDEMMRHFQAVLRIDTSNPPGNETWPSNT